MDQTSEGGQQFEDLYEKCMNLPAHLREQFIQLHAGHDPALVRQLRTMIPLEDGLAEDIFGDGRPAAAVDPYDLKFGAEFGNCQIKDPIAAGGMGAVYYAVDLQNHDRPVALKVLQPWMLKKEDPQRFRNETSALSRLVHPNIAQLYFRGVQRWNDIDRPFLVMEYVEGVTLDKFLDDNDLTLRQVVELLKKIAGAVHFGHLKGVFHRDLKPSNILVTAQGEPKIIDFGVSFTVGTASIPGGETQLRENVGTLPYMAPEVASGAEFIPDARTDVYSLGIIAFEAFARRRPGAWLPNGELQMLEHPLKPSEIRHKISTCERERLREFSRSFDLDLDCIIAKSIRLKMGDRYTDAGKLEEDFGRLLRFETVEARPKTRRYSAQMFLRRNRVAATATVAVFAVVTGAAFNFRRGEIRVNAALVQTTAALKAEAAARKLAVQRGDEIQRQSAAAHAHAAELADQRGNWTAAADEYQAAEAGGFPDHLALAVGELRAFDRLDRPTDANALIDRVNRTMPEVAGSPQFRVREGFFRWSTDSDNSVLILQHALARGQELSRADRAFAQALTTDDIQVVADKLRETVEADPFNRDAWTLLALTDLGQGKAAVSERDAAVLQELYPDDEFAAVVAAFAAAFQQRPADSVAYLNRDPNLPPELNSMAMELIAAISKNRNADDYMTGDLGHVGTIYLDVIKCATLMTSSHTLPCPLTFRKALNIASPMQMMMNMGSPARMLASASALPGIGDYLAGSAAITHGDPGGAVVHLQNVLTSPSLIDCRREAASMLVVAHWLDEGKRNVPMDQRRTIATTDLDRVISLGGIPAIAHPEDTVAVKIGYVCQARPQVRALSLMWMSHTPDDPQAMFYFGWASLQYGDPDTARSHFKRAIAFGLGGDLKKDAEMMVKQLSQPAATRATTMP